MIEKEVVLEVKNLKKYFPASHKRVLKAVDDVSFTIHKGETFGIVGESGCGKTTCGKTCTGILTKTDGQVLYQGKDVHQMSKAERNAFTQKVQTIFQDPYASLDPHQKVYQIVSEGMRIHHLTKSKEEEQKRVMELLEMVGLNAEHATRNVHEFSGGQRQRVAFARALAPRPQVLLLDAPFAAIDAKVRSDLRLWLRSVVTKLGITSIFVTHDQDEAVEVADEIIITNHGTIEQIGTPAEIYNTPDTPFVAQFIGRSSLVEHYEELHGFDKIEGAAKAVIRPEFVKIHKFGKIDRYMSASQDGIVKDIVFRGNRLDVTVDVGGIEIICEWPLEKESLEIGEKVSLLIYRLYVLDKERTYLCENKEMQEDDVFYI